MEQAHESAGARIQTGDVWPLEGIVIGARQSEVATYRLAAVLAGNNVVDLERQEG
jgi:hypothetical protein